MRCGAILDDDKLPSHVLDDLPVINLGGVKRWSDFILALGCGRLDKLDTIKPIPQNVPALIIAVDLNYDTDTSVTKSNAAMQQASREFKAYANVQWSSGVDGQPPTGAVIGWGLITACAMLHPDIPIVAAVYTGWPSTMRQDAMTVLTVGQLLALSDPGRYDPGHNVFSCACEAVQALQSDPKEAIKAAMPALRDQLLVRLGAKRAAIAPTLLPVPWSAEAIIQAFEAEPSDFTLDQHLAKQGLEAWTRDGTPISFDLRSLFLDVLQAPGSGSSPALAHTRPGGAVYKFVNQICDLSKQCWEEPASVIRDNVGVLDDPSRTPPKQIIKRYDDKGNDNGESHQSARLLGLVFASVEAAGRSRKRLDSPWDLEKDAPSTVGDRTLRQYMKALWTAFPADEEEVSEQVLLTHVRDLANKNESQPARALLQLDVTSEDAVQEQGFRDLVRRGIVCRVVQKNASSEGLSLAGHPKSVQHSDSYLERKTTINRLLGWLNYEENNLLRTPKIFYGKSAGAEALRMIIYGESGLPRHLREAARWYHGQHYQGDHKKDQCPPHCAAPEG